MASRRSISFALIGVALLAGLWILREGAVPEVPPGVARIQGRVRTALGPWSGVRLELLDVLPSSEEARQSLFPAGAGLFDPDPVLATTESNEEGWFKLSVPRFGRFTVRARAEGRPLSFSDPFAVAAGQAVPFVGVRLDDPRPFFGIVKDEAGLPVAGAEVVVCRWMDLVRFDYASVKGERSITGASGRFESAIAGERVIVAVRATGFPVFLRGVQDPPVEIVLSPAATISGTVTDQANGRGIRGAHVRLCGDWDPYLRHTGTTTDADGRYVLAPVPADVGLWLAADGPGYAMVAPEGSLRTTSEARATGAMDGASVKSPIRPSSRYGTWRPAEAS